MSYCMTNKIVCQFILTRVAALRGGRVSGGRPNPNGYSSPYWCGKHPFKNVTDIGAVICYK